MLDAWVDFDGDGLWSDELERIVAGASLTAGIGLFAGGEFGGAGGLASAHFGRWGCTPREDLTLNDNRFRIEVSWEDFEGNSGAGHPVQLTDGSGYFWFFDADNIELVVKVLDACIPPYHRFWVFAAGLTNVEVTMTVTDTEAEEELVYTNPLGQAFQPILDTDAFATCGASNPFVSRARERR